jgi:uncharacterized protein
MTNIALLPSSSHVLPGGRLEIIVAEKRYTRMVKDSLTSGEGFAMCMLNENEESEEVKKIPAIATHVKIIDFNALEGGLLVITVEGIQKIRLLSIEIDPDGLLIGEFKPYLEWIYMPVDDDNVSLREKLKLFYSSMPEIGALYNEPKYNDISWVCQRWIEVLPIEVKYKQLLITQDTTKLAIRFLKKLLDYEYYG